MSHRSATSSNCYSGISDVCHQGKWAYGYAKVLLCNLEREPGIRMSVCLFEQVGLMTQSGRAQYGIPCPTCRNSASQVCDNESEHICKSGSISGCRSLLKLRKLTMRDHRTSSARSLGRPLPCTVPSSSDTRAEDLLWRTDPPRFYSS